MPAAGGPQSARGVPVLLLAYQGLRTQEALQVDWRWVDFARCTVHLAAAETKARRGLAVTITRGSRPCRSGCGTPRASRRLVGIPQRSWRPHADTRGRGDHHRGANLLSQAHATACRTAGVTGFRVHDWRHDWASRMVWAGTDLPTPMRIGGRREPAYAPAIRHHINRSHGRGDREIGVSVPKPEVNSGPIPSEFVQPGPGLASNPLAEKAEKWWAQQGLNL
jgi:integrase